MHIDSLWAFAPVVVFVLCHTLFDLENTFRATLEHGALHDPMCDLGLRISKTPTRTHAGDSLCGWMGGLAGGRAGVGGLSFR